MSKSNLVEGQRMRDGNRFVALYKHGACSVPDSLFALAVLCLLLNFSFFSTALAANDRATLDLGGR